jgi:predicted permease
MPLPILLKLLAIFAVVALGYAAGRWRWLAAAGEPAVVSRALANAAFTLFMPALLFRTTARIDLGALPWSTLAVYFGPLVVLLLAVYGWQRARGGLPTAGPGVRAITACFGNTVLLGIPIAAALFGDLGLTLHVAIVSVHALTILSILTVLVELDLARARSRDAAGGAPHGLWRTLRSTVRSTVVHPVVTPLAVGVAWNLLGLPIPEPADEALKLLGQAGVPLALVVLGLSFADQRGDALRQAAGSTPGLAAAKLLLLPALVYAAGRWGAGLDGVPLAVVVMCAALPTGANALIFAQRYDTLVGEVAVATVASTLAFVATAPLWLWLLGGGGA